MELVLKRVVDEVFVPDDAEYVAAVEDILYNETFQSMKEFPQHGSTSCLAHSIAVSYLTWHTCKKLGLRAVEAARGALLHDLFLYDWHTHKPEKGDAMHGFTHPKTALENAKKEFDLTELEQDIILKHMWPLTPVPPSHKESYVVCYHDKICSLRETMRRPLF
ncbi:HD family phosphohydrolase [Ruminococcaceae bacterium OttesenSCG-928-D13]|nr:HD family phosphohydrolase [Ruminococcaceae bacterium OttesenSCG-928-D13]